MKEGATYSIGGLEIHVVGTSGAVERVEGVHRLHLTSVSIHAARRLARLDVAPYHGCHVALVVHEASIEVWSIIGVGRGDVSRTTREWILQEMEHSEEVAWWHDHMVTEPTSDYRVVHNWLVGLVLEVAVPARPEFWARPLVHHCELFLCRADLDTCFDTVGGEGTSAVDVPLLENLLLGRWITAGKVVEGLDTWLGSVCGEGQVVILEVETDTWQVDERFDASLAELLWVTNTGSLKDEWRAESATRNDDLLPSLDDSRRQLTRSKGLGGNDLDADSTITLKNYLLNLVIGHQVQVLMHGTSAMDVAMGRVRTTSSVAVDPLEPVLSSMARDQVLEVISEWNTLRLSGSEEIILDGVGVVAKRYLYRALKSMDVTVVAGTLVCLVLLHEWDELLGSPTLGLEVVVVGGRSTSVHLSSIRVSQSQESASYLP
jgi:hypothetical protein